MKTILKAHRIDRSVDPLIVERMRLISNISLPETSTRPSEPKTAVEQQAWWQSLDHSKRIVTLYRPENEPWEIAAFSVVTDRGDHCTPYFATDPRYRGQGIGEQIIRHYLSISPKQLYGEALAANEPIHHLNMRLGWKTIGFRDNGKVELLYHPGPSVSTSVTYPDYEALYDWATGDKDVWAKVL